MTEEVKPMPKKTILQECWIWNGTVTEFIKDRIIGRSLNVCAGANPICDINIDLDPKDKSILKGEMRCLGFEPETFDAVVQDPPWKIGYYERMRPFFECVRVCKIGGRIIYNATWIPRSDDVELDGRPYVRQDNQFSNASVISIFKKFRANPEYEAKIAAERGADE